MMEIQYKHQLEDLIHAMRSPLVVLSLAGECLMEFSKDKTISMSADKMDEYTESLNLIQSSTKRLNDALKKAENNALIISQEEV